MSHTPGEWKVADNLVYALNNEGSNRFCANVMTGWADKNERTSEAELAANAKLIAAAPELLGACRMVMAMERMGGMLPGVKEMIDLVVDEARNAIKKATV